MSATAASRPLPVARLPCAQSAPVPARRLMTRTRCPALRSATTRSRRWAPALRGVRPSPRPHPLRVVRRGCLAARMRAAARRIARRAGNRVCHHRPPPHVLRAVSQLQMIPWLALLFAGVAFFSTMAGGFAALRWPGRVQALAALAGGVVLGAAFFDLLPEAIDRAIELKLTAQLPVGACLVGFLGFYTLERFLHHHHEEDEGPSRAGLVGAAGFIVHSVFDGLAIGLGFRIDTTLGLLVALAVIGHDFSDGLNTVSYLITHG